MAQHSSPKIIQPSLLVFFFAVSFFALIILDGYVLNFCNLSAEPTLILILIAIELSVLAFAFFRSPVKITGDPLILAGFFLVVIGTWLYLVFPSLPTLLPPSYSGDAPNHLAYVNTIFSTKQIFGDYPGGPALIAATLAHWICALPLRVLHPLGALWLALTAGAIYGIACALLHNRRAYKTLALFVVFALFVQWNLFAGILFGMSYFWTQVAGQFFIVAFLWFLYENSAEPNPFWSIGMALCLMGLSVSFQLWIALPVALLGWATLRQWCKLNAWQTAIFVGGVLAIWWVAIFLTGGRYTSTLSRLIGEAAIIPVSLETFGGAFLILPALGILLGIREHFNVELVIAFLVFAAMQTIALLGGALVIGVGQYWIVKSLFVWVFPLALLSIIPLAVGMEFVAKRWNHSFPSPVLNFGIVFAILATIVLWNSPSGFASPLTEPEVQVALWAKEHLGTQRVHFIGRKNIVAQWLGVALWGEKYPDDIFDFAALGPKTFEEWRDDPTWGEYLFVSSNQHFNPDSNVRVVFEFGSSSILQRRAVPQNKAETSEGNFGDLLTLTDYALSQSSLRAGNVLSLTLQLETGKIPAYHVMWRLQVRDLQGNAIAESRGEPFGGKYPLQRWPDGMMLTQPLTVPLSVDVRPGLYDLQLGLYEVRSGKPIAFQSADGVQDDVAHLPQIKVALPPVTTHELAATERVNIKVGSTYELLGYRLKKDSPIRPGDSFQVVLYWHSLASASASDTVFVHLLDASGKLIAQHDSAPRLGTYPTTIWEPNEIIIDAHSLTIPGDAANGDYRLEVGMYQWPSLQRLPVEAGDHIVLPTTIHLIGR